MLLQVCRVFVSLSYSFLSSFSKIRVGGFNSLLLKTEALEDIACVFIQTPSPFGYIFDKLPIDEKLVKPRVGIVGEILVKFLPSANNYLVELLEAEGAEAVMPDLLDFFFYSFYNSNFKHTHLGTTKKSARVSNLAIKALEFVRRTANSELKKSKHFSALSDIRVLAQMADKIVSQGNQTGEGWFLTAEMLELIHEGAPNIVCAQPFGCLPNHVVGKGVIKELRRLHPEANIVAVDYDPGASEVNQLNRIKLMLASANKNLSE